MSATLYRTRTRESKNELRRVIKANQQSSDCRMSKRIGGERRETAEQIANGEIEFPNIKEFTAHYKVSTSIENQDIFKATAIIIH